MNIYLWNYMVDNVFCSAELIGCHLSSVDKQLCWYNKCTVVPKDIQRDVTNSHARAVSTQQKAGLGPQRGC